MKIEWLKEIDILYRFIRKDTDKATIFHTTFEYECYSGKTFVDRLIIEVIGGKLNALKSINKWNSSLLDWKYILTKEVFLK